MPKKSDTTIDEILKEMRIIQREKKRDKLFSKIDSSFFVLITLATFFSSITITWHQTLIESKALPILVGLVSTLLYAFVIGFKGMVSDSLDTRTFSWTILLTSCYFLLLVFGA